LIGNSQYILALDTSGPSLAVAVLKNEVLLAEKFLNISNQHSVNLLPVLDGLIQELDLAYNELSAVAVAVGPGSFTGIRIGVSTANTLAYGLNVPVLGISSLEALAYPYINLSTAVLALFDARGGRLYGALFKQGKRLISDRQFVKQELPILLQEKYSELDNFFLIGDGFPIAEQLLQENGLQYLRSDNMFNRQDYISAANLGLIAFKEIRRNPDLFQGGYQEPARPNYCVITQAERNLAQKENQ
jgi:tRNA threonylcarbamoyladenosine biosynthesis protein TsaB